MNSTTAPSSAHPSPSFPPTVPPPPSSSPALAIPPLCPLAAWLQVTPPSAITRVWDWFPPPARLPRHPPLAPSQQRQPALSRRLLVLPALCPLLLPSSPRNPPLWPPRPPSQLSPPQLSPNQ